MASGSDVLLSDFGAYNDVTLDKGDSIAGEDIVLNVGGFDLQAWVAEVVLETEDTKIFCHARLVFTCLGPLDQATSLATVHLRCMRPKLHLHGSNCNAAAVAIPVQESKNGAAGHCG